MLDIQLLRNDLQEVAKRLADRGVTFDTAEFEQLEANRKAVQTQTQELQAKRNQLSKQVGQAKAKGEDASALMGEVNAQADKLKALEHDLDEIQHRLDDFLAGIPNIPHASVPAGNSSDDNQELRKFGNPRQFDFAVKDHVDIGAGLKMLDFDVAAKISGARFALMKGGLARLHRAHRAIHARRAHAGAWLYRGLCAISGECAIRCAAPGNCRSSRRTCSQSPRDEC